MKKQISFLLNDEVITTDVNPGSVLLDFIRKNKNLTGTKEGCREGDCGACAVLSGELTSDGIKYLTINSCLYPMGNVEGKHIVTIEGINSKELSPIQKYFVEEGASQCGFCTPGFINSLTWYFLSTDKPDYSEALDAVSGNICRCTGYSSIKRSIQKLIDNINFSSDGNENHLQKLIDLNIIPNYFTEAEAKLHKIAMREMEDNEDLISQRVIIGGGTDLYVQKADSLLDENLQFHAVKNQSKIFVDDKICTLSSNVTFEDFRDSQIIRQSFPDIIEQLNLVASKPIRNTATIAGNIVNASPIGDMTIFLLALDSTLTLTRNGDSREILLRDFYKGYKTLNKDSDELIDSISFELPSDDSHFNFEKVSKRTYLDIASVNTSIHLKTNSGKFTHAAISAGGVGPTPLYLKEASRFLIDKTLNSEIILELLKVVETEISPISDVRGTAEYKSLLLKQLIKAHFLKLFPEISFESLV